MVLPIRALQVFPKAAQDRCRVGQLVGTIHDTFLSPYLFVRIVDGSSKVSVPEGLGGNILARAPAVGPVGLHKEQIDSLLFFGLENVVGNDEPLSSIDA